MLHVIVTTAHANEGPFPTYPQGTAVDLLAPCDEFFDWHACRIQGRDTYVYVHMLRDGALAADYNPTELDVAPGDHLEVLGIQGAWLHARDAARGRSGWIPAEKTRTVTA